MKKIFILGLIFVLGQTFASSRSEYFVPGMGGQYLLKDQSGAEAEYSIVVADSDSKSLQINYGINIKNGIAPVKFEMQANFVTSKSKHKKQDIELKNIFLKMDSIPQTQRSIKIFKRILQPINIFDLIVQDKASWENNKISDVEIEVPAGKIFAEHFKFTKDGQTVEVWASENNRPVRIVKLISTGTNPKQNYSLELVKSLEKITSSVNTEKFVQIKPEGENYVYNYLKL